MTKLDFDRIRQFLLIVLSSEQPGEVAAAIGKVTNTLASESKDIFWLVDLLTGGAKLTGSVQRDHPLNDDEFECLPAAEQARWALDNHADRLSNWEFDFLTALSGWNGEPTSKQAPHLVRILARLRGK